MAEYICESGGPDWEAHRRAGVTATDIVTILGLSSWDSPYSLYWRKLLVLPDEPGNDRFRLGQELEPYVAQRWREESHVDTHPGGLYASSDRPWQLATPDRLTEESLLECKTWADSNRHAWDDGPPPAVRAQIQWQMDVMNVTSGYWAVVFLPSGEFRHGILHRNEEELEIMRLAGLEFHRRVQDLRPPDVDSSTATLAALKHIHRDVVPDKHVTVDAQLWSDLRNARNMAADWSETARFHEALIRDLIGEATVIDVNGLPVGRRLRYQVKEHTVKAHTVDRLMSLRTGEHVADMKGMSSE